MYFSILIGKREFGVLRKLKILLKFTEISFKHSFLLTPGSAPKSKMWSVLLFSLYF